MSLSQTPYHAALFFAAGIAAIACRADVVDDRSRQPMKLKIPMGMEQKFVPKVQHPDAVLTGGSYEQRLQYYRIVRFLGQKVSVAYCCKFSKTIYI